MCVTPAAGIRNGSRPVADCIRRSSLSTSAIGDGRHMVGATCVHYGDEYVVPTDRRLYCSIAAYTLSGRR
jgi:hypothetical protein